MIRTKKIAGFERYEINEFGTVTNTETGKHIKSHVNRLGYPMVMLSKNGKQKLCTVHRLLALAFIPNPENKSDVNHINGVKHDYRLENLEWCSKSENKLHSIRTGTTKFSRGAKHHNAIFNEAQVRELRSINNINYHEQARMYNASPATIWLIVNRKTYKDVV